MSTSARVPVLMYHQVADAGPANRSPYCVSPERFRSHMTRLADHGYRAVPLESLLAWLEGGPPLAQGDFVLTFDDGFCSVRDHALPVLERLGWPCAVFVVTDLLGGVDSWNVPPDAATAAQAALLTADELLEMRSRGCEIHSHTRTHRSLPQLDDEDLNAELTGSREALVKLLGAGEYCLAYPFGRVDERVRCAAVAAGYRAALSVQPGFNRQDVDRYQIRRIDVVGHDSDTALLRKIQLGTNDGSLRHWATYRFRQAIARLQPRPSLG
ncbi:polysaccharide deacetylase family protein [Azohydromonas sediminis]|uniref:polysaccharide deacetylase family protein n=1 Tax=Azohydromonas sediminis TaxID=2259674 RepID=UPI000E650DA7|nr:polysaccharide deacetylase family protein [Azohydromonas sediminis]